ncbi:ubiquinol-cytochrome C chaperone family protein [uncultured Reyranella sp.]|uniref:ubiquinol-cytochrome C chaperone family protein n=1 Tax=uncultured Reyranella sp. TaxID=735512 RepID=UPI0025FAD9DA|nr:ubiquinol-cytochrome C chaperone family protein [uncultured Reyranella sp.]
MYRDQLGRESFVFRRRKPEDDFAATIYNRVAEQARTAELFESCGIPDTLDGRFDSLALHAALMIDRLRREPDGEPLSQAFFDAMFRHLDLTLREIGIQDLGVGRRIKIMAEGLHGRALAYREALNDGPTPLAEVLRRNAYGGRSPQNSEVVARLEAYVRDYVRLLGATARNDLIK